jgi:hypothetical protein
MLLGSGVERLGGEAFVLRLRAKRESLAGSSIGAGRDLGSVDD